jgi:putative Mg2+ transporter-C (MgtC) family protein
VRDTITISWDVVLLRLVVAALLGAAIGLERELREREAGLRTHILVCVGSALFTLVSAYGFNEFVRQGQTVDPTRIAAQIVTGIGFIGAGAIIRRGLSVRGVTTAATLWVVAAIGIAAGAGYYTAAVIATVVAIIMLEPLGFVAARAGLRSRGVRRRLVVDLDGEGSAAAVFEALEELGVRVESFDRDESERGRRLSAQVEVPRAIESEVVIGRLAMLGHVAGARWGG